MHLQELQSNSIRTSIKLNMLFPYCLQQPLLEQRRRAVCRKISASDNNNKKIVLVPVSTIASRNTVIYSYVAFEDLQDVSASAAGRKFAITVLPIATCCHLWMHHDGVGLEWHADRCSDKLDEGTALPCVHVHELLTQPSNLHSTSHQTRKQVGKHEE